MADEMRRFAWCTTVLLGSNDSNDVRATAGRFHIVDDPGASAVGAPRTCMVLQVERARTVGDVDKAVTYG